MDSCLPSSEPETKYVRHKNVSPYNDAKKQNYICGPFY